MADRPKTDEPFSSVNAALQIFRRGSRGPLWYSAAEYLVDNASYDTQMLIDYVIERTRREAGIKPPRKRGPLWWVVGAVVAAATLGGLVYGFIHLYRGLGCA